MKGNILKYKNFIGTVQYSGDDEVFYGKIDGIDDLVSFEGGSVKDLRRAFEDAVDDYLRLCEESGKDPLKSFRGSFNVRIPPDLHKKAYLTAAQDGKSLNQFVQSAIDHEVRERMSEYGEYEEE